MEGPFNPLNFGEGRSVSQNPFWINCKAPRNKQEQAPAPSAAPSEFPSTSLLLLFSQLFTYQPTTNDLSTMTTSSEMTTSTSNTNLAADAATTPLSPPEPSSSSSSELSQSSPAPSTSSSRRSLLAKMKNNQEAISARIHIRGQNHMCAKAEVERDALPESLVEILPSKAWNDFCDEIDNLFVPVHNLKMKALYLFMLVIVNFVAFAIGFLVYASNNDMMEYVADEDYDAQDPYKQSNDDEDAHTNEEGSHFYHGDHHHEDDSSSVKLANLVILFVIPPLSIILVLGVFCCFATCSKGYQVGQLRHLVSGDNDEEKGLTRNSLHADWNKKLSTPSHMVTVRVHSDHIRSTPSTTSGSGPQLAIHHVREFYYLEVTAKPKTKLNLSRFVLPRQLSSFKKKKKTATKTSTAPSAAKKLNAAATAKAVASTVVASSPTTQTPRAA